MRRWLLPAIVLVASLAGCAGRLPAPVTQPQPPTRVEAAPAAVPAVAPAAPVPAERMHVVKRGETLSGIARQHGVGARDLAAWNQIEDPNRIEVGQQLRLAAPAPAAAAAAPEGAEIRPIAAAGGVAARPLDGAPPPAATAPALLPGNTETLKRAPKGGKLPYSEENLARLRGEPPAPAPAPAQAATPAPAPGAPAAAPPAAQEAASGIDWGWPANGRLLAEFSGGRAGTQSVNLGIDIGGAIGDPVLAAASGRVIFVGVYPKHGNLVVLQHDEAFITVYAHLSRTLVREGQTVRRGQRIADLGNSDADQPKLHFELRQKGKPLDPLRFLPPR